MGIVVFATVCDTLCDHHLNSFLHCFVLHVICMGLAHTYADCSCTCVRTVRRCTEGHLLVGPFCMILMLAVGMSGRHHWQGCHYRELVNESSVSCMHVISVSFVWHPHYPVILLCRTCVQSCKADWNLLAGTTRHPGSCTLPCLRMHGEDHVSEDVH